MELSNWAIRVIPMELKFSVSYKLVVVCVSTVEREIGPFKVSKHKLVLHETLTVIFPLYCILLR